MSFYNRILYDIKRLFSHGKTALLALLSPIPAILLFAAFIMPLLSLGNGTALPCAVYNEDESEEFERLMNLLVGREVEEGTARIYPVKSLETGLQLVEDGKVAALLHIRENTYWNIVYGQTMVIDYYYSPAHALDATIFSRALRSTLSVFGQGMVVVRHGGSIALERGLDEDDVLVLWADGTESLLKILIHRGRVIGWHGVFSPGGDFPVRYYVGVLFAICVYFASFPVIGLTAYDLSELYKRKKPDGKLLWQAFFARLLSGTLLMLCVFGVFFPVAGIVKKIDFSKIVAILSALVLIALTFSALGVLLGSLFPRTDAACWAGLYIGAAMLFLSVLSAKEGLLPGSLQAFSALLPMRVSISIFSNDLYHPEYERYSADLLRLFVSFVIFAGCGFFLFRKRGSER